MYKIITKRLTLNLKYGFSMKNDKTNKVSDIVLLFINKSIAHVLQGLGSLQFTNQTFLQITQLIYSYGQGFKDVQVTKILIF